MKTVKYGPSEREVLSTAILVVEVEGRAFDAEVLCIDLGIHHMIGYRKPVTGCVVEDGHGHYTMLAAGKSLEEAVERSVEFLKTLIAQRLEAGTGLPNYTNEQQG